MMAGKRGEFGFVWIFAIMAGIAILLLMIYGATRAIDTTNTFTDTKLASSLSSKLDPLESGSATTISSTLKASKPTRISIDCLEIGYGDNKIQISTKSKTGSGGWSTGEEITIKDKYLFSDSLAEGKEFNIFSKSFSYPYKIADLIFITSNEYCFKDAPTKIKNAYRNINGINVNKCTTTQELKVCFDGGTGCDVQVEGMCNSINCETKFDYGLVRKNGTSTAYADTFLMAAIVADQNSYTCNAKRLMFRGSRIADLLSKKANLAASRGCYTNLDPYLSLLKASFPNYVPQDFISNTDSILEIKKINELESCGLW